MVGTRSVYDSCGKCEFCNDVSVLTVSYSEFAVLYSCVYSGIPISLWSEMLRTENEI